MFRGAIRRQHGDIKGLNVTIREQHTDAKGAKREGEAISGMSNVAIALFIPEDTVSFPFTSVSNHRSLGS